MPICRRILDVPLDKFVVRPHVCGITIEQCAYRSRLALGITVMSAPSKVLPCLVPRQRKKYGANVAPNPAERSIVAPARKKEPLATAPLTLPPGLTSKLPQALGNLAVHQGSHLGLFS